MNMHIKIHAQQHADWAYFDVRCFLCCSLSSFALICFALLHFALLFFAFCCIALYRSALRRFNFCLIDVDSSCFALQYLSLLGCGAVRCGFLRCRPLRCGEARCDAVRALCPSMCLSVSVVPFKYFSSIESQPHPQSRHRGDLCSNWS